MVFGSLFSVLKWTIIITAVVFGLQYWLNNKSYMFTDEAIAVIAKKHIASGSDPQTVFRNVHKDLLKKYPGHILPQRDLQWIFVNAGGWMGSMCLVHASLTEYVLFFGSAIETSGHSGRYWANISDTVMSGTFRQWKEGSLQASVYTPGDTVLHEWGEATAVNFGANTWMVEYGRGFIPSTMTFALADTLFSTTDFMTMFYTFRIYGKALVNEYCNVFVDAKNYVMDHI